MNVGIVRTPYLACQFANTCLRTKKYECNLKSVCGV